MKIRLLTCSFIFLLVGCGLTNKQIIKIQSFGSATEKIGILCEEEFVNIRNGIIQMNKELVIIDNSKNSNNLDFDKPTFAEPTAERLAACKALKLYGELLINLVTENRDENIQNATNSLIDNMNVALGVDLSDEQKGAVSKIIVGLGHFWVDKKKADAAKEIIPAYQKTVDKLADLLLVDFSLNDSTLGYLKAYHTVASRLKNAAMRLVNAGDDYSVLERDRAVEAFYLAETAINRAEKIEKIGAMSIKSLKKANKELCNIIKRQTYDTDDIKNYAKQIQEFVNMYQVLTK